MRRWWWLVGLALIAAGITSLELDRHTASHANANIVALDTAGKDVAADRASLESFVKGHWGTSQTVVLEGSYQRAQQAATQATAAASAAVYAQAQITCGVSHNPVTQATCNQSYVESHPVAQVPQPQLAAYTTVMHAPHWNLDPASILLLLGLVVSIWGFARLVRR